MDMNATQQPVRLKDAKPNQLGQVPIADFIDLAYRGAMLLGSAVCAGVGTGSIGVGLRVFFGLLFLNRQ